MSTRRSSKAWSLLVAERRYDPGLTSENTNVLRVVSCATNGGPNDERVARVVEERTAGFGRAVVGGMVISRVAAEERRGRRR